MAKRIVDLSLELEDHQIGFLRTLNKFGDSQFNGEIISLVSNELGLDHTYNDNLWNDFHALYGAGLITRDTTKNINYFEITNLGKLVLHNAENQSETEIGAAK